VVDGQLDVEDIVRDRVGSELQRMYEVGHSFSCSCVCCHIGLVYGNILGPKNPILRPLNTGSVTCRKTISFFYIYFLLIYHCCTTPKILLSFSPSL
jgi:hypothetical protein